MFKRHLLSVAMALSMVSAAIIPAHALPGMGIPKRAFLPQTTNMAERGRVSAPFGHIEFCVRHPSECRIRSRGQKMARLSRGTWLMLKQVNSRVNRSMRSQSDHRSRGKIDHWSVGGRVGDCEDYALTKRHELIRRGWSSNTVLVATVRDRRNRSHAVLVAHTNRGDFVLDNLTGSIRSWDRTGYRWLKRQSRQNPKKWVRLNGRPQITGSLPAKSVRKAPKSAKIRQTSPLASLRNMRRNTKVPLPQQRKARYSKLKMATLPPLPSRSAVRHHDTRIAQLLTRLAKVQKRLAVRAVDHRIARLLTRLKNVQKRLIVKTIVKRSKSRQIVRKNIRKRKVVRKTLRKWKTTKRVNHTRSMTRKATRRHSSRKALALLKKIRKGQYGNARVKPVRKPRRSHRRSYKRKWVGRAYGGFSRVHS